MMSRTKTLRCVVSLVVVAFGLAVGGSRPAQAELIYVVGSGNEFGTLDLSTGAFNPIADLSLPTGGAIFGIGGFSPTTLVAIDDVSEAYFIDTGSGNVTDLGNPGLPFPIGAGGTGGILFAYDDFLGFLVRINFHNFTAGIAAFPGILGTGLVAKGPDKMVYITGFNPTTGDEDLFQINPRSGAFTDLGPTGDAFIYTGAFVGSTLYGFDPFGNILTLDTTTGAASIVGTYTLPNGDVINAAAAITAVPEPSSIVLMGLGVVGVAVQAHRQRVRRSLANR